MSPGKALFCFSLPATLLSGTSLGFSTLTCYLPTLEPIPILPVSSQEAEDEKSVLMAAVQSGGEEANLLLPELGSAFYDVAR